MDFLCWKLGCQCLSDLPVVGVVGARGGEMRDAKVHIVSGEILQSEGLSGYTGMVSTTLCNNIV